MSVALLVRRPLGATGRIDGAVDGGRLVTSFPWEEPRQFSRDVDGRPTVLDCPTSTREERVGSPAVHGLRDGQARLCVDPAKAGFVTGEGERRGLPAGVQEQVDDLVARGQADRREGREERGLAFRLDLRDPQARPDETKTQGNHRQRHGASRHDEPCLEIAQPRRPLDVGRRISRQPTTAASIGAAVAAFIQPPAPCRQANGIR